MRTEITLAHPDRHWWGEVETCLCRSSVLHTVSEHPLVAGKSVKRRCSVCDQEWGEGAISQHEYCAFIYDNGDRVYAHPDLYLDNDLVVYAD